MAVVVSEKYSTQAIASKHSIIEGRAVILSPINEKTDDLPYAIYPDGYSPTHVWVALSPPDTFKPPVPHDLYTASRLATYNVNDPAIYTDPSQITDDWLVPHSAMLTPIIHQHEKVGLVRGIVGITSECYQDGNNVEIPGELLAVNPNGLFRKSDRNHPIVVAQTVYYQISTGVLYIHVF